MLPSDAVDETALAHLKTDSDLSACLVPLLTVMGWRGDPRHIAEALPHFQKVDQMARLRAVLAHLNYRSRRRPTRLRDIDPRLLPCLFLAPGRGSMVLLDRQDDRFTVFSGRSAAVEEVAAKDLSGVAYFLRPDEGSGDSLKVAARQGRWCRKVADRFFGLVLQMLAITLLTNLLALAVPLFIMVVYDKVIGAGSPDTLYYLFGGVLLALLADAGLRLIRARILAYVAGRIDMMVGTSSFQHLLRLSVSVTERAAVGAQIARLRQFESIREFFSGPLAAVILDLPFALIFVGVIAIIAGPLAWVPICLAALFALVAVLVTPRLRRVVSEAGEVRSRRGVFPDRNALAAAHHQDLRRRSDLGAPPPRARCGSGSGQLQD